MTPAKLVALAQQNQGGASNYKLSKITGISEGTLSQYVADKAWPKNTQARLLAEAAGLPWAEVIAELEIERAKTEQERTAWGKALASMRGSADALLLAWIAVISQCAMILLHCGISWKAAIPVMSNYVIDRKRLSNA